MMAFSTMGIFWGITGYDREELVSGILSWDTNYFCFIQNCQVEATYRDYRKITSPFCECGFCGEAFVVP